MRFMIMVKANADSEAGRLPTSRQLATMGHFNEELIDAGVLLAAEGLQPSRKGARVAFRDGKTHVFDGPFADVTELVAAFWIIQVKDRDEALAWARRAPMDDGDEIEIRQVFEPGDMAGDRVSDEAPTNEQARRNANQNY